MKNLNISSINALTITVLLVLTLSGCQTFTSSDYQPPLTPSNEVQVQPTQTAYTLQDLMGIGGGKLMFKQFESTSTNPGIYIINADGTDLDHLINHKLDEFHEKWSPDGRNISLLIGEGPPINKYKVYTIDENGGNLQQFSNSKFNVFSTQWSTDGKWISFIAREENNEFTNLYIQEVDGEGFKQLTSTETNKHYYHAWSPDSSKIAYLSIDSYGWCCQAWVVDIYNDTFTHILDASSLDIVSVDAYVFLDNWSSDGEWVVFQVTDHEYEKLSGLAIEHSGIYIVRSDGSEIINITKDDDLNYIAHPLWSPDGKWIAFSSSEGIHLWSKESQQITSLPDGEQASSLQAWLPNSEWLLITLNNIPYVISLDGSQLIQIPNLDSGNGTYSWQP